MQQTPLGESAVSLAGYALAHAAGSISEPGSPDELLCPFVMLESNGGIELIRFEADTQAEAIQAAKSFVRDNGSEADAWALAREGTITRAGMRVDVLVVDASAKDFEHTLTLIQQFQPFFTSHLFRLIGKPDVALDGVKQNGNNCAALLGGARTGIAGHVAVAEVWDTWGGWSAEI